MFENFRQDWRTYNGDLSRRGLWVMAVYRFGRWRYTIKPGIIRKPFSLLYKVLKVISEILTSVELPCEVVLGRGVIIEHAFDIVISGDAVLGDDVVLRNGVTIGLRHRAFRGSPVIGNRVDIGAGAKILGPITIGDDVSIGANAVVLTDVPANSIAVGIPARIQPRSERAAAAFDPVAPPDATALPPTSIESKSLL
jgi:serine O-acetyltransferase